MYFEQAKHWEAWDRITPLKNVNKGLRESVKDLFADIRKGRASPWWLYFSEVRMLLRAYSFEASQRTGAANSVKAAYLQSKMLFGGLENLDLSSARSSREKNRYCHKED